MEKLQSLFLKNASDGKPSLRFFKLKVYSAVLRVSVYELINDTESYKIR